MTCIAGIVDKGKVYIGGDSLGNNSGSIVGLVGGKVYHNGEFLIGGCGAHRLNNLVRYSFEPPTPAEEVDLDEYMATAFVDELRSCLTDGGYICIEEKKESIEGMLMVGFRARLYVIDGQFAAVRPLDNFAAIGSGSDIALGALFATKGGKPEERLKVALEAAEHLDDSVRSPFHIESV
jgi:ATP-dependent protease HslVU (ClpYQ) peptidase subunit